MRRLPLVILSVLLATACSKSSLGEYDSLATMGWMQIEVKVKENPDCHVPEIIFLTNKQKAYAILDDIRGTYLATGLPDSADVGDRYIVEIVRPLPSNAVSCTSMGASWAQAHIIQIQ